MSKEKVFDRSIAFTFYKEWKQDADTIEEDFGAEVKAAYYDAIINYALFEIEPEMKAPIKYFWNSIKEKIDASQKNRSKGFREDTEMTQKIINYKASNPTASQRTIAEAVGCSAGKVNKVLNTNTTTNTSTSTTTMNVNVNTHAQDEEEKREIFDWGVDSSGAADFNVNGTLKINNRNIIDIIYPVNSIYMSLNSVNPSTLFGGTWEQIKDTFLLAAGATYKAGSTGGEATHKLTQDEMPKHNHVIYYPNAGGPDEGAALGFPEVGSKNTWWAPASMTGQTGGSAAHNNMPPYLAVYIWKRTA